MSDVSHEMRFPTRISLKSRGGPERRTEIVTLSSGHEQRNTRWADSRRTYNAGYGVKSLDDVQKVLAFFEQQRGRLYGFRWKDHADYKSCPPSKVPASGDQLIGTGDGVRQQFQLVKSYGSDPAEYRRTISRPVDGTVSVSVDENIQADNIDYTMDMSTGMIIFITAPPMNAVVSAGFEFDVPVRFGSDKIEVNLDAFNAGQIPDISIVEIKQ